MVKIEKDAMRDMIEDAEKSFPNECCGFLYGVIISTKERIIQKAIAVPNSKEGDQRRRFYISPKDYMKAEKFAEENSLELLGVYHSHPNHPAIPSEHDRVAAQPNFSYIILSVQEGKYNHIRSWQLNEKQIFEEEKIY